MQEIFDDMLRGNLAQRSGAKFVPGCLNVQFTKDALLKDEFDEWLARIICYAFSVPPTPFVKQSNRATADNASDSAMAEGLAPIQNWVKSLIDRVLAEDFAAPDLEFAWNEDRALSPTDALSVNTGYVAAGLKTRNEIRADLGLGPLPGGDVPLVTTPTGLVPIVLTRVPVGKDWHFDPAQPRDAQGRWTAGGGDEEGDEQTNESDQLLTPVQEIILPTTIPWDLVGPDDLNVPNTGSIPSTQSNTLIDPAIAVPYSIPDDLTSSERKKCQKEWQEAYNDCRELQDQGELGKPYSGLGFDVDECAEARVSGKCGGSTTKYKKNPKSVGESKT